MLPVRELLAGAAVILLGSFEMTSCCVDLSVYLLASLSMLGIVNSFVWPPLIVFVTVVVVYDVEGT